MTSTQIKQTKRQQILNYGDIGKDLFDKIEIDMGKLAQECADVAYQGPRSDKFKTDCIGFAMNFSYACTDAMIAMTTAVNANTSFIAEALGGDHIGLEPPTKKSLVTPTFTPYSDTEMVDGGEIRRMRDSAVSYFNAVRGYFGDNEKAFLALGSNGGWIGDEYEDARDQLVKITGGALETCDTSEQSLVTRVNDQLTALKLPVG